MVNHRLKAVNAMKQPVTPKEYSGGDVFCAFCGKKLLVCPTKNGVFFAHRRGERCDYDAGVNIKGFKESWKQIFRPELCDSVVTIALTNRDYDYIRQSLQPGFDIFKFAESWKGKRIEAASQYTIDSDVFIPADYKHSSYEFDISGEGSYPKKGIALYFLTEPLSQQEFQLRNTLLIGAGFNVCWIYNVVPDVNRHYFTRSHGRVIQEYDSRHGVYDVQMTGNLCTWKNPPAMLEGFTPQKSNGALKVNPLAFYLQTKDVNLTIPGDKWFLYNPIGLHGKPNPWNLFTVDFQTASLPALLRRLGYGWDNLHAVLKPEYAQSYSIWAKRDFERWRKR